MVSIQCICHWDDILDDVEPIWPGSDGWVRGWQVRPRLVHLDRCGLCGCWKQNSVVGHEMGIETGWDELG